MSVKIIGGLCKGKLIKLDSKVSFRPTSVLLRRKIFDAHQYWQGIKFVDICAGSGVMGLEAWSRGAPEVHFVEPNRLQAKNLEKLCQLWKQETPVLGHYFVSCNKAQNLIKNFSHDKNQVIFLDPPYEEKQIYLICLETLAQEKYPGTIWVESCRQKSFRPDEWPSFFKIDKLYWQGTSYIAVGHF